MTPSRSAREPIVVCADPSDASVAPRPQVLVVDDVPANLLAMGVLLEDLECDLRSVSSGPAALSLLLRDTFAVMLLDVRMPGMDGYEVARLVRMCGATRDLPIIFLTAESPTEEHLRLGYDAGAVDYLFKPLSREILRSKVRVFLELFQSRRELSSAYARLEAANTKLLELVDAEAAASSALRQANHELGSALRASQTRIIEPAVRVAERQCQTTRAHFGAASHELGRLVAQVCEPAEKSAVFTRSDLAEPNRRRTSGER